MDFSSEFNGQTDIDSSLAAATVIKTMCDTGRVSKVIILVAGQPLIGSDKVALGALGSDDIVYDGSQATKNNNMVISLYFADKSGQFLQLEQRTVKQNDKEPLAKNCGYGADEWVSNRWAEADPGGNEAAFDRG